MKFSFIVFEVKFGFTICNTFFDPLVHWVRVGIKVQVGVIVFLCVDKYLMCNNQLGLFVFF